MWFCLKRESGMPDLIGGKDMKTRSTLVCLLVLGVLTCFGCNTAPGGAPAAAPSRELLPLQLIQRIPTPGVTGRIDHFTAYPKRRLLIFAALGNNTVEVVNSFEAKVVHSIKGLNEPQGVLYIPEFNKLFVANAGSGIVNVYDGKTWALRRVSQLARKLIRTTFGMMMLPNGFLSASW